jgi:hypothetical protein
MALRLAVVPDIGRELHSLATFTPPNDAAQADACVRLRAAIYRVRTKLLLRARRHRDRNRCGRR